MMKPTKIALLTALACAGMGAQAQGLPAGPSIVYGSAANSQTVFSAIGNPAAPAAVMQNGTKKQFRMGVLSFGGGVEFGKVDVEEANNASDELQALSGDLDFDIDQDQDLLGMKTDLVNQINPLFAPVNRLLGNLGRAGDLTSVNLGAQPFTPFVLTLPALGGSLVFDASMEVVVGMKVVNDTFIDWTPGDVAITGIGTLAGPVITDVTANQDVQDMATAQGFDLAGVSAAAQTAAEGGTGSRQAALDALNGTTADPDGGLVDLVALTVTDLTTARDDALAAQTAAGGPGNNATLDQAVTDTQSALDAATEIQSDLQLLTDAVEQEDDPDSAEDKQVQYNVDTKEAKANVKNDSTLLVRVASIEKIGVGYSRNVWSYNGVADPRFTSLTSGGLSTGVRMKFYRVGLKRHAVRMADGEDAMTQFEDAMNEDLPLSTGFGLDAGVLWTNPKYRVGLWVNNANSPKFKYNRLDLTTYENQNGDIVNSLGAGTTYEMKPQVNVEASWTPKPNVAVNFTADANESPDPIGRDYQWMTLSAAYATNSWWIPGVRAGYRKNLVGTELDYATLGLRWLGVDLDAAMALDSIEVEGDTVPRGMMLYLSTSFTF